MVYPNFQTQPVIDGKVPSSELFHLQQMPWGKKHGLGFNTCLGKEGMETWGPSGECTSPEIRKFNIAIENCHL